MQRRMLSKALLGAAAGTTLIPEMARAQTCAAPCYPASPAEIAAGVTIVDQTYPDGNVLRYGADPTGVADSTAAFRAACFSHYAGWDPTHNMHRPRTVFVPAGRYKLLDAVYVRSGVAVIGAGMGTLIDASNFGATAAPVFKLGWSLSQTEAVQDQGGYPPEICNMHVIGGPSGGGAVVDISFPGALCHDMWFAAPGVGVYLAGGYLYDCEFDLGLIGVRIGPSTNQTVSNCRFYLQNICMDFDVNGTDVADCTISGCTFEYAKYVSTQIGPGGAALRGVKFLGCNWVNNNPPLTHVTNVHITNDNCQIEFEACTFHNWTNFAVQLHAAGAVIDFKGCLFDGEPTHRSYLDRESAGGIDFGLGTLRISSCQFRNFQGPGIAFSGAQPAVLEINGLNYSGIEDTDYLIHITNTHTSSKFSAQGIKGDAVTPLLNAQPHINVQIKNAADWFGPIQMSGSRHYITVPYQASSLYQICLTANQNAGGSGSYRKSRLDFVEKNNDFNGGLRSFVTQQTQIQGAANLNGSLAMYVEFTQVGGGTSIGLSNAGVLAVSWPSSYTFESVDVQLLASG